MRARVPVLLASAVVALGCSKTDRVGGGSAGGTTNGGRTASGGAAATAGTSAGGTTNGGARGGRTSGGATSKGGGAGNAGTAAEAADGGEPAGGGVSNPGSGGSANAGGGGSGAVSGAPPDALGAYPFTPSTVTRGGTMTFTNVGAPGWWPRRIDREAGDPACTYKDGTDTWGGHCCMTEAMTTSDSLAPFDEEMTFIVKAIDVKQLAVYQPKGDALAATWDRVTAWDRRTNSPENLWFTQEGNGSASFPGDLTHDDCVGYVMQQPLFECGDGHDYYCPNDPGILHRGYAGSKLVVFLGSMNLDDAGVASCSGTGAGKPSPWVAFVASELVRDGGRKWNGLCNCYSKTGSVGDGCGEINVFEVVMDDNQYSNREFASTGIRSFQEGHVGGAVCQSSCERETFPEDVEVVDACAQKAYEKGPEIAFGGVTDGCPVWRRPDGDRYFFILLDAAERMIQVGIVHPGRVPKTVSGVLPNLPKTLPRTDIDAVLALRLPAGNDTP
jgi:hypothetical protein